MLQFPPVSESKTHHIYGHIEAVYPYLRYYTRLHNIRCLKIGHSQDDTAMTVHADNTVTLTPNVLRDIGNCRRRFYCLIIDVEPTPDVNHSSLLYVDTEQKEFFLFDPYGYDRQCTQAQDQLLHTLHSHILSQLPGYTLTSNLVEYKHIPGPQRLQKKLKRGGFCVSWCVLFMCLRCRYPDVSIIEILEFIISPSSDDLLALIQRFTREMNIRS